MFKLKITGLKEKNVLGKASSCLFHHNIVIPYTTVAVCLA